MRRQVEGLQRQLAGAQRALALQTETAAAQFSAANVAAEEELQRVRCAH